MNKRQGLAETHLWKMWREIIWFTPGRKECFYPDLSRYLLNFWLWGREAKTSQGQASSSARDQHNEQSSAVNKSWTWKADTASAASLVWSSLTQPISTLCLCWSWGHLEHDQFLNTLFNTFRRFFHLKIDTVILCFFSNSSRCILVHIQTVLYCIHMSYIMGLL